MEDESKVYDLFRREKEKELSELKGLRKVHNALKTPSSWTKLSANVSVKKSQVNRFDNSSRKKSRNLSHKVGWEGLKREKGTRPDRLEAVSRLQQKQRSELSELREMGVVQESLKRRKQTREAAMEMFGGTRRPYNLRKQANVLVNSRETNCDEAVAQFVRQSSHAFVEAFFGVPSKSQRVLERLTAQKLEDLTKTLKRQQLRQRRQARASDREVNYREHDDDSSTASTPATDMPKQTRFSSKRPATAPDSTIINSTSPRPLLVHECLSLSSEDTVELDSSPSGVSTDTVTSAPTTPAGKPGWYLQENESDRICGVQQEKDGYSEVRIHHVGSGADDDVDRVIQSSVTPILVSDIPIPSCPVARPCLPSLSESDCSDESRCIVSLPWDSSLGNHKTPSPERGTETTDVSKDLGPHEGFAPHHPKGLSTTAKSDSDDAVNREVSCTAFPVVSTGITQPAALSQLQPLSPASDPVHSAHELATTSVEVYSESFNYEVQSTEFDSAFRRQSSAEVSEGANDDECWSSSTSGTNLYRSVSSPLISDTSAFNTPFSEGFAGGSGPFSWHAANLDVNIKRRLKRRSQKNLRRSSTSDDAGGKLKSLGPPPGAWDNPGFVQFCNDRQLTDPTRDDYIAFKLRHLGDNIDITYGALIEQFLQKAVVYAMQEKLSYQHFCRMSQELALQAHRVQERALLVACFGRRLWEKLPEYQETISQFTALTVEEIGAEFFLSMGLAPDINPYDPEICRDYDDWRDVFEKLHSENGAFSALTSEDPFFQRPLEQPPAYATIPRGFQVPRRLKSTSKDDIEVTTPILLKPACLQLPDFQLRKATSVEVLLADANSESDGNQSDCDGNQTIMPGRVKTDPSDERHSPSQLVKMRHNNMAERGQLAWTDRRTRHQSSNLSDVRTFDCGGQALEELDRGKLSLPGPKPVVITSLMHEVSTSSVSHSVRTVGPVPGQSYDVEEFAYREEFSVTTFEPRLTTSDEFPNPFTSSSSSLPDGEVNGSHNKGSDIIKENSSVPNGPPSVKNPTESQPRQRRRSSLQIVADAIIPLAPAISAAVIAILIRNRSN